MPLEICRSIVSAEMCGGTHRSIFSAETMPRYISAEIGIPPAIYRRRYRGMRCVAVPPEICAARDIPAEIYAVYVLRYISGGISPVMPRCITGGISPRRCTASPEYEYSDAVMLESWSRSTPA